MQDGEHRKPATSIEHREETSMRTLAVTLLMLAGLCSTDNAARARQSSCKICDDQQRACAKNYAAPTCKSEYQMCMKSCRKK
jgi:hypothetical protein